MELRDMRAALADFAAQRDWQQFHTPKNLAMALAGEAGELLALFQWLTPEQASRIMETPESAAQVRHEMADVLSYLVRLADVLDIDLAAAIEEKMQVNALRYPQDVARGRPDKYDKLMTEQGNTVLSTSTNQGVLGR